MNIYFQFASRTFTLTGILIGLVVASCFMGCDNSSGDKGDAAAQSKLPKMKFHRPKNATLAAKRLRAIHDSLVSESELPKPTTFSVVEVIHGEGRAAHSHFYLESKWDPEADDHHHEDMKTTIEKHQLEVDVFTELKDIVAWTPNIAAAADLSEDDWNSVNKTCQSMEKLLEKQFGNATSEAEKRDAYKKASSEIDSSISKLESLVANPDEKK